MPRDHDIDKILDKVLFLFPNCKVWQQSQICENNDGIYRFWLNESPQNKVLVVVENDVCWIQSDLKEKHLQKRRLKKNKLIAEMKKPQTIDEIALIICEYFLEVQTIESKKID